jgi:hypothetical protein
VIELRRWGPGPGPEPFGDVSDIVLGGGAESRDRVCEERKINSDGMKEARRSEEVTGNEADETHEGPGDGGLPGTGSLGW